MGKKKDFLTREDQEKTEGYKTQEVKVPEARFQTKQQEVPAVAGEKIKPVKTGFEKQKTETKGSVLKQEVAARVVDSGIGGDIPGDAVAVRGLSYGGNEGTILASAAYTPIAGQARADSRTGKKLDAVAKKINFVPSEQIEETFDESKPLAESPDAVQGYNGTYRNINARAQKNVGAVPAELLYTRSIDEIKRDQLYFSTGQVVKDAAVSYADTPNLVPTLQSNGVYTYGNTPNYTLTRGNYLNKALRIKYDAQGRVTKMAFDTIDISTTVTDDTIMNDASANHLIDMNAAELDRQNMDAKAGDEKADVWTPLARAIPQPTRTVGYLRDIENITGAEIFLAYKKTAAAMSYQLNRASKDGMKLVTPMAEALLGLVYPETNSTLFSTYTINDIFDATEYRKGAASLFIAINDSVAKYNNKADILTQPRSLKLALQAADNNMNPLRVKADYVKVVNSREVFSTIDREYDPLQPVCISDKSANIHCYNFNDLYAFNSLNADGTPNFIKDPFIYAYSDLRNSYLVEAAIPLLAGLHKYLSSIGPKMVSLVGANQEVVIPIVHSTCFFSLWDLFILSAVPFITRERVNSMRDVLYYEKNVQYPFSQLITIREANPMNAVNYGNDDYNMPLVVKRMNPAAALTWILPEVFWPMDELSLNDNYKYVLPWYFNQVDYDYTLSSMTRAAGKYSMSMPSVRSGVRFGYLDDIFGMTERDVRLSLDRLVDIPAHTGGAANQGVYKYSQNADGIPFCEFTGEQMTITNLLKLPRELGWFMVAPAGVLSKIQLTSETFGYIGATSPCFGQSSYLVKFWHGRTADGNGPTDILKKPAINVNRATAYRQDWDAVPATQHFIAPSSARYDEWGFALSLNDIMEQGDTPTFVDGKSKFIPFTNGVMTNGAEGVYTNSGSSSFNVISLQKALWTRVQKLPFAVSPFDMRLYRGVGEDACKVDPYDFLYYFGLAGFKASEYDEDVYNRSNAVTTLGFGFLSDPFFKDSPLVKEAGFATQSENTASLI